MYGGIEPPTDQLRWAIYLRWPNGKRQTMVSDVEFPDTLRTAKVEILARVLTSARPWAIPPSWTSKNGTEGSSYPHEAQ
jgi:hypothetical protein